MPLHKHLSLFSPRRLLHVTVSLLEFLLALVSRSLLVKIKMSFTNHKLAQLRSLRDHVLELKESRKYRGIERELRLGLGKGGQRRGDREGGQGSGSLSPLP